MKATGKKIKMLIMMFTVLSALIIGSSSVYAQTASVNNTDDLKSRLTEYFNDKSETFTIDYTETSSLSGRDFSARLLDIIDQSQKATQDSVYYSIKTVTSKMTGKVGDLTISINVEYWSAKSQDEYVDSRIDEILGEIITPDMNIYQKERAVYDYITSNVSYSESLKDLSHTAYSALKNGQAVCQGFAVLTNKMLEKAGIENRIISGIVNGGEFHVWNIVNLDGKWYHLDTTWDAPQLGAKVNNSKKYFNVTSDFMKSCGHKWEENEYPAAFTVYDKSLADNGASKEVFEKAVNSILVVEISKTNDDYAKANEMVSSLPYSSDKVKLQKALASISEIILSPSVH